MRYAVSIGIAAVLSFVLFFVALFGPGLFEPWKNTLTDLHCESGETFVRHDSQHYTETHMNYFCRDEAGHTRDVTGWVLASSCGVSLLFFLGFSLLFVLFSFIFGRNKLVAPVVSRPGQTTLDSPQVLRSMESEDPVVNKANTPLAARLQQLQEALNQGLISQGEYDQTRRAILDRMDD